ncbi:MAG: protein phosphatase 2C domain-containing protein, partial [Lapillicoccus sp.]
MTTPTSSPPPSASPPVGGTAARCPNCGAPRASDALFCEECAFDFTGGRATSELAAGGGPGRTPADPVTAEPGSESPLDVGWTGPVSRRTEPLVPPAPETVVCTQCGEGRYEDGYCDVCGSKERDPRDHFVEEPAAWVAGVCDIGRRHRRNEDAMALHAEAAPLSFAVLVVCDGVSNSTDSHIASLAASRAARDVLDEPAARGMGTRTAVVASIEVQLDRAVQAARAAVVATTADREVENPPSCTFVAAVVDHGVAVVGSVGDSRAYWLPDAEDEPATQLSQDDSWAAEQISAGVSRHEAETSPGAHAITRWLGADSPDDLTPHTADLDLVGQGWLLVCSDGLWNYCSEAEDLRGLVRETMVRLGSAARHPASLAQALTDFAIEQGGMDNITVTLARVGT